MALRSLRQSPSGTQCSPLVCLLQVVSSWGSLRPTTTTRPRLVHSKRQLFARNLSPCWLLEKHGRRCVLHLLVTSFTICCPKHWWALLTPNEQIEVEGGSTRPDACRTGWRLKGVSLAIQ